VSKWLLTYLIILFQFTPCLGEDYRLVSLSTVKARSLAMGGATLSIKDDLASLDLNPAAFSTVSSVDRFHFTVFVNPMGPLLIMANREKKMKWDVPIGWTLRGASLSVGRLRLGILLGEESLGDESRLERKDLLDCTGYEYQRNNSFGFSLILAPRVSLGISGEMFIRSEDGKQTVNWGYKYGILVRPRKDLNIGLCFFGFPNLYNRDRMVLERLPDETLNIGISYSPWSVLTIALDVRNVSDEGKGAIREPHMGVEVSPVKHLTLRAGYYPEKRWKKHTFSAGIGLFDWNSVLPLGRRFSHTTCGINASFLIQKEDAIENHWFILSMVIRI